VVAEVDYSGMLSNSQSDEFDLEVVNISDVSTLKLLGRTIDEDIPKVE